jgi:hypothetical protein
MNDAAHPTLRGSDWVGFCRTKKNNKKNKQTNSKIVIRYSLLDFVAVDDVPILDTIHHLESTMDYRLDDIHVVDFH